jgi:threonine synthase
MRPLRKYDTGLPQQWISSSTGLGEGNTALVRSSGIGPELDLPELYFKSEHLNPTGSFKDRFAAVEVALMRQAGITSCVATSSGNTGSALAAYTARQGINCHIFVNEVTPANKLTQMAIYGAQLYRVREFGVSAAQSHAIFKRIKKLAIQCDMRLVVSAYEYSPGGMEGVKAIAFELVEQLGGVPDLVFIPVGGGGLLTAVSRGFADLQARHDIARLPRLVAVQPELNDTIVTPFWRGETKAQLLPVAASTTISGLAVQVDIDATRALQAVRASHGWAETVSDFDCFAAREKLSKSEGLYVEAAGATAVAGLMVAKANGRVRPDDKVVCLLTGHGFKDTASDERSVASQIQEIGLRQIERNLFEPYDQQVEVVGHD